MNALTRFISVSFGCLLFVFGLALPASALNTMVSYQQFPPTITEPTKPNVLVMISNDYTGFYQGYNQAYDNANDYWGYFDHLTEYSYKNGVFSPEAKTGADHYKASSTSENWSGNFLNWATMSHADFLRKALTGGLRANDTPYGTTLARATIPSGQSWSKQYNGTDIAKLVDFDYATPGNFFDSVGDTMTALDSDKKDIGRKNEFTVVAETCTAALPEGRCTTYPSGYKPEGLLQRYKDEMLFGLMSYSHGIEDQGGIVRQQIKDLNFAILANNGGNNSAAASMMNYLDRYTDKGWDPLAEMFYDGVRYLRGNASAQAAFCPTKSNGQVENSDDGEGFYGCTSGSEWEDPVQSWCQKNSIVIINDEYPSAETDSIPYSAFNPSYRDTPMFADDRNTAHAYNPDVVALLAEITANEGLAGSTYSMGKKVGASNNSCSMQSIDNLANFSGVCPAEPTSRGTFYLAALAYDALKNDMRSDHTNKQTFRTYAIAFRASPGGYQIPPPPLNQMYLAGKYGNFDDKNGNNIPDLDSEWMESADLCALYPDSKNCLPKGFFYAEGGDAIEASLVKAFESILRRSASGTAVSVLATSGQGEGNLVQAYYRPTRAEATVEGSRDVQWTGYLQSLWVDRYGNLREDSNNNLTLDVDADKIISYFEAGDGSTMVTRFDVSSNPYPATDYISDDQVAMGDVKVIWEAGQVLADTTSAARNILTGLDTDLNGVVETDEVIPFNNTQAALGQYLALQDTATENGDDHLGKLETTRTNNLIAFIRGDDPRDCVPLQSCSYINPDNVDVRDRRISDSVWKLGDIINSTPVTIAAPPDRFDLIYGDTTYGTYYNLHKNRETMVYVGGNDGMLHAFTSWKYNRSTLEFEDPDPTDSIPIGSEVWAYIPQNLLPHLKWLARPNYSHVHYMDMQPRIFDAQIYSNSYDTTNRPGGWATIMVVGMNTGGGTIEVPWDSDFTYDGDTSSQRQFKPSYMAFDITEPRNPVLLWERTYEGLGFTRTIPTVMRIEDATAPSGSKWFMVFGNGPDAGSVSGGTEPNYAGESITNGRLYIVDLVTGSPYSATTDDWWAEVADPRAFFSSPVSYDRFLNYNVDAAYMGTTYDLDGSQTWKGSVYRLLTLDSTSAADLPVYDPNPLNWRLEKIFDSPRPITAPGTLSTDSFENVWAYFGTGRYLNNAAGGDKESLDVEYLFAVKDPFYNKDYVDDPDDNSDTPYYFDFSNNKVLDSDTLMDATPVAVLSTGYVKCYDEANDTYSNPNLDTAVAGGFDRDATQPCDSSSADVSNFNDLLDFAWAKDGWIRALPVHTLLTDPVTYSAERNLNTPAVLGGSAFYTTFSPTGDLCSYGGTSSLWALYYETGTAFTSAIFQGDEGVEETYDGSGVYRNKESYDLGSGMASSVGFHLGTADDQGSVSAYVQMGSGGITKPPKPKPPQEVKNGLRSWIER